VTLKQITYFLTIIENGSLSKAASSLYLTQPTLSRFLEKLEADVGVNLFTRNKNNTLSLTEAGKHYLEAAVKIQKIWNDLDTTLMPLRGSKNKIIFGIDADHMTPYATECADKVMEAFPDVTVDFFCDTATVVHDRVADGSWQMGLCSFRGPHPELQFSLCTKTEINLVVSKNHPLAAYSYMNPGMEAYRLSLHSLPPDTDFAMMVGHSVWQDDIQTYLNKISFTPNVKRSYIRLASIQGILESSSSLGFCPANTISSKLAYIALDPPFYFQQGVCQRKNATHTPAEKYLFSLLMNKPYIRKLD
jgi:DNA-binding transcriptional LysR family regulator